MNDILENSINNSQTKIKFSSFVLLFILTLLPFDSYLGEVIPVPIVPGLLVFFIISKFFEFCNSGYRQFEMTPIILFISYGVVLNVMGFLEVGVTYNFLLFFFNIVFYAAAIFGFYNKKEINGFIKTAPFSFLIFIIICIKNMKFYGNEIYMSIRDITDPNYLVTGLVLVVAMQMFLIFKENKKLKKFLLISELCVAFGFMILIGSRGGLFACLFTVFLSILFGVKHPFKLLICFGSIFIVFALLVFSRLPADLLARFDIKEILHGTGSGRTIIWSNYMNLYMNADLFTNIFGFGRDYIPSIYFELFGHTGYYPHNLYIKTLAEGGLFGFTIFIIMVAWSIKRLKELNNGLVLSAFLGLLVGSIFLDMDNMRIFWVLLFFITISKSNDSNLMWRGNCEVFNNSSDL